MYRKARADMTGVVHIRKASGRIRSKKLYGRFQFVAFCGAEGDYFPTTWVVGEENCLDCLAKLIQQKEDQVQLAKNFYEQQKRKAESV